MYTVFLIFVYFISLTKSETNNFYMNKIDVEPYKMISCGDYNCYQDTYNYSNISELKECEDKCYHNSDCKGLTYQHKLNNSYECTHIDKFIYKNNKILTEDTNYQTINLEKKEKKCYSWCKNHETLRHGYKYALPSTWEERCSWEENYCSSCVQCKNLNNTCQNSCKSDKNTWDKKCFHSDNKCSTCDECKIYENKCSHWCSTNPNSWEHKCKAKEKHCSECKECISIDYRNINCSRSDLPFCYNRTKSELCKYTSTYTILPQVIKYYCPHKCDQCLTSTATSSLTSTATSSLTSTATSSLTSTATSSLTSTATSNNTNGTLQNNQSKKSVNTVFSKYYYILIIIIGILFIVCLYNFLRLINFKKSSVEVFNNNPNENEENQTNNTRFFTNETYT